MKHILIKLISVGLVLLFSSAQAEIYSWVDKEGKKHFGQEVPKEYAKKSTVLDVKNVNAMDETKVLPASQNNRTVNAQAPQIPLPQEITDENLNSCEQKKRAYEASVACYASCRLPKEEQGTRVNNVSACGHCMDVKKPSC